MADEAQAIQREVKDSVQRVDGDDDFFALAQQRADEGDALFHVGHHVAVGQHRALGRAGGAAGILQEGQILAV